MPAARNKDLPRLLYSCHSEKIREAESFVKEHYLIHILSGNISLKTISDTCSFAAGDTVLIKRDQLVRVNKLPAANGEFKSVSVSFDQTTLKDYSLANSIPVQPLYTGAPVTLLSANPLYTSYASSLTAYQQEQTDQGLTALKVREALMLILYLDKEAAQFLFDFYEPSKIDLENFMNTHFRFNVGLDRFAYLTGRSLATFKRDFAKIFHTSPSKWLQQRRLKEAYHLIREKRMKPSAVYLEVGFEDLSHFSFAFKNTFGKSPASI
ncbi:MAG: AraC family transcriptional regulator [Pedobacter sp.]|uniref:helix-turn-helix domain-containing protein n=1 Tax=Pedobacter sp. TaxID=1411316 RepID=UPI00339AA32B